MVQSGVFGWTTTGRLVMVLQTHQNCGQKGTAKIWNLLGQLVKKMSLCKECGQFIIFPTCGPQLGHMSAATRGIHVRFMSPLWYLIHPISSQLISAFGAFLELDAWLTEDEHSKLLRDNVRHIAPQHRDGDKECLVLESGIPGWFYGHRS